MLHRLLRNSRPVRARIAARLARPCVGAFWRPVTRRGYHCRGQPGSAKGKPALVDRQNRRWLPGRFVVAGFGAVSKKCCLLRWDRGFESVFLQRRESDANLTSSPCRRIARARNEPSSASRYCLHRQYPTILANPARCSGGCRKSGSCSTISPRDVPERISDAITGHKTPGIGRKYEHVAMWKKLDAIGKLPVIPLQAA